MSIEFFLIKKNATGSHLYFDFQKLFNILEIEVQAGYNAKKVMSNVTVDGRIGHPRLE